MKQAQQWDGNMLKFNAGIKHKQHSIAIQINPD